MARRATKRRGKKASLDRRLAAIQAGGGADPNLSQRIAAIQSRYASTNASAPDYGVPAPQSLGDSVLDSLKNIGGTALNVLSVPQAAVFTAINKLSGGADNVIPAAVVKGIVSPGAAALAARDGNLDRPVGDVSWKNAVGGFYKNYKGFASTIAEPFGAKPSALQTAFSVGADVAADPLWGVAPTKITKALRGVEAAEEASSGSRALETVARAASEAPSTRRALEAGQVAVDEGRKPLALLEAGSDGNLPVRAMDVLKPKPYKPPKITVKRMHRVHLERDAHPLGRPLGERADKLGRRGTLVDGRYFITRVNRTNKARLYHVYDLGDDASTLRRGTASIGGTYKSHDEALKAAKGFARAEGSGAARGLARAAEEPVAVGARASRGRAAADTAEDVAGEPYFRGYDEVPRYNERPIEDATWEEVAKARRPPPPPPKGGTQGIFYEGAGGLATPAGRAKVAQEVMAAAMRRHRGKGTLGVKFGFGPAKAEGGRGVGNFTLDTGIPLPGRTAYTLTEGNKLRDMFRRSPVQADAHRLDQATRDSVAELGQKGEQYFRQKLGLSDAEGEAVLHVARAMNTPDGTVLGKILVQHFTEAGLWGQKSDAGLRFLQQHWREMGRLEGRGALAEMGDYAPGFTLTKAEKAHINRATGRYGTRRARVRRMTAAGETMNADISRKYLSVYASMTPDQLAEQFVRIGLSEQAAKDAALDVANHLIQTEHNNVVRTLLKNAKDSSYTMRNTPGEGPLPDFNLYSVANEREMQHVRRMLQVHTGELLKKASAMEVEAAKVTGGETPLTDALAAAARNPEDETNIVNRLKFRNQLAAIPGTLSSSPVGRFFEVWTPKFKRFLTTVNMPHLLNNFYGDYFNSLRLGSLRHAKPPTGNFSIPGKGHNLRAGGRIARLSAGDEQVLAQTFHIGGRQYSGQELYSLAHMMGMGRGYVGSDIGEFIDLYSKAKGPYDRFAKFMGRWNQNREDAMRIQTWLRHMDNGDDPFNAAMKTIDSLYDYNDLTDFERVWMRNTILFYTWMRKNMPAQFKGLAQNPGLYSAVGDMERNRPHLPYEPEYVSELGLLNMGPLGQRYVAGPWTDLYKLNLANGGIDSFRKNVLSATTPAIKVPIELATGKNLFTGGDLSSYADQNKPSGPWDRVLNATGFGTPTRQFEGGPKTPAIPWQAAYFINQFKGPIGGNVTAVTDDAGPSMGWTDILSQFTGAPPRQVKASPDWPRQQKIAATRRKAAATRKRNAER